MLLLLLLLLVGVVVLVLVVCSLLLLLFFVFDCSSEHGVMMRLLRQLLFFGLLFEGLGMLSLKVLLSIVAVCLAIVMCAHFACSRDVNSA